MARIQTDQSHLQLNIVTADRQLVDQPVLAVNAPAVTGEITVLPDHVPLLSKLQLGELRYQTEEGWQSLVISQGFLNVQPDNKVTVMVDTGIHQRDISVEQAQQAIDQAHQTLEHSQDRRELLLAEASLKKAMLEIKVAQKTKKSKI